MRVSKSIKREFEDIRKKTESFINEVLLTHLKKTERHYDENPEFLDFELLQILNSHGFFSLWMPKALGGRGYHPLSMNVFNELMGAHCLGVTNIVGAHYMALGLLSLTHNYSILRRVLRTIRVGEETGQACLLSAGVTEPSAGTDREDFQLMKKAKVGCWAEKTSGGYRLHGSKAYISNAAWARWHVVVSTSDPLRPESNTLILLVENKDPVSLSSPEKKMGQHSCPASSIFFNECFVPDSNVAIKKDFFHSEAEYTDFISRATEDMLMLSRASVGVMAAGVAQKSFEMAFHFFQSDPEGQKFRDFEWVQAQLVKLKRNADQALQLSYDGTHCVHQEGPFQDTLQWPVYFLMKLLPENISFSMGKLLENPLVIRRQHKRMAQLTPIGRKKELFAKSCIVKFTCTDLAYQNCVMAIDLLGTRSFSNDGVDLHKMLKDCKLLQIYEGTNQLNQIQAFQGLDPSAILFEEPIPTQPSPFKQNVLAERESHAAL